MANISAELENNGVENGFEDDGFLDDGQSLVRIGKKPTMNYVVACMTLFNKGLPEIMVRARGQSITKAVETVDMLRRAFMRNVTVESVEIGTETIKREDGNLTSLSTIEIILGD